MPNIDNELGRIKTAIRGEDMRSAIYNAMRILASDATRMDSKISEQSRSLEEISLSTNNKIKEVQLIGDNGEKLGVLNLNEALEMAQEKKLDLVLVAPQAKPPVCKIMNYGKYKFEQAKKEKEAKKKQKVVEIKEIRITPNIEEHDFSFKAKNARKFIEEGNKLKITVRFRGREVNNSGLGEEVLNKFIENLSDIANVDRAPKLEGRNMFIMLSKK